MLNQLNQKAMVIKLNEVPRKQVSSFTMFADPDRNLLRETKTVEVSYHFMSKTRLSVSMQFGTYCVKINHKLDNFKQFENTEWNYFSGNRVTSYYFIKSKAQNFEKFKEYVIKLVELSIKEYLMVELDELTINLEVREKF